MGQLQHINTPSDARPAADAVLVARAKADPAVFGEIYREHYRAVAGCIYRRVGNAHAAEDLAAETFIAAYGAIRRFKPGPVPLRHWLLRIATNAVNRWMRRQRLARWSLAVVGAARAAPGVVGGGPPQAADRLAELLCRLPRAQQSVVSLHYFEGLSVEETGAALGCSTGTVKSRLSRARATLKELIEGERA